MNELRPDFARPSLIDRGRAPLLERNDHAAPSVFRPENMLREARRQKGLGVRRACRPSACSTPTATSSITCGTNSARPARRIGPATTPRCGLERGGVRCGIVGHVVGGAFSVLVAEQLFASGCRLLINVASAGQITDVGPPPYYILIDRALRDEGTSYHYLPPSAFADADPR